MSKGPGIVEKRIADLFAATRDRALSIDEITDNAYGLDGGKPTREQRLSATRAAHRLLRRVQDADKRSYELFAQAHASTKAALGRALYKDGPDDDYRDRLARDPAYGQAERLSNYCQRIGRWLRIVAGDKRGWLKGETDYWVASLIRQRLFFHPPDVPVRVWAVKVTRDGIVWAEAEVLKITERNVMVRYAGETARLDRKSLWYCWAFWRGVQFVSMRSGRIAVELERLWHERFGGSGDVPAAMRLPLADAIALLGVKQNYSREDVIAAFRQKAKLAHPDLGGTAEMFRKLVEARDRLLSAIGTTESEPEMPEYAPSGTHVVYRTERLESSRQHRIGGNERLLR
jgi:hypothetical protein